MVEPGDLLVVHENKVAEEPRVAIDSAQAEEVVTLTYDAPPYFPRLRTVPAYYAGKNPLERQDGPRFVVHVYRIHRAFTPLGLIPPWLGPKDREVGAMMRFDRALRQNPLGSPDRRFLTGSSRAAGGLRGPGRARRTRSPGCRS